ncbi:hypothetical protein SK428_24740, partial [Escherichia coli]|nr:hypothetical protein [Escherichia coli]
MMNIEELRKIFCEDGLYAVCVENGNLVSHYRIMCLRKNVNRPGFPGECFICELRLPDHRFRWK